MEGSFDLKIMTSVMIFKSISNDFTHFIQTKRKFQKTNFNNF